MLECATCSLVKSADLPNLASNAGGTIRITSMQNEPAFTSESASSESRSWLISAAMRLSGGLLQGEKQANYAVLALSCVALIVTFFLLTRSGGGSTPSVSASEHRALMLRDAATQTLRP